MSEEYLGLKWGTLKAWDFGENKAAMLALKRYHDSPVMGFAMMQQDTAAQKDAICVMGGAMMQQDTAAQKDAICDMIDAVDGEIRNEWSGEVMTKEQAKKYVREYQS